MVHLPNHTMEAHKEEQETLFLKIGIETIPNEEEEEEESPTLKETKEEEIKDSLTQEEETKDSQPPPLDEVEAILGYNFKNKCLLEEAFTHSSYHTTDNCSFSSSSSSSSYERLEYVGDSVLNLLVTKEQFFSYPNLTPGHLTRLRAANVDTEKLARVAIKHGLHRYLLHKKPRLELQIQEFTKEISEYPLHSNGLIDVPKDLADIVESTIGAVFIDCDSSIEIVWKIFKSLLEPIIDPDTIQKHPVTELYEICQKKNLKIQFIDLWKDSMSVDVLINEKLIGRGICGTKKEIAHNRAAKNALDNIERVLNIHLSTNEDTFID